MSDEARKKPSDEDQPQETGVQIDFAARRRLEKVLGGNRVSYCYPCGACVGDCPSARF